MEVEDRHLNVIVDLINKMLIDCEPLSYLSEQFSPSDMVWRLSQLIIIYENSISSDSQLISALQYDINENSLSACSAIRIWLLEYYKSDFVTLNEFKLEDGVEEEIVLTALMVLRVLYHMRQMLDLRFTQVLTKCWLDLHDFDDALDEKFETRCLKFMALLVKHSIQKRLEVEQLVKQINCLIEEKSRLEEKLRTIEENSTKSVSNQISVTKSQIKKVSNNSDKNEISLKSVNLSPRKTIIPTTKLKIAPLSQNKTPPNLPKSPCQVHRSPTRNKVNSLNSFETNSPSITPLSSPVKRSPLRSNSPRITSSQQTPGTTTRRSLRLSNSSTAKMNGNEVTQQNTFRDIQAIFAETDESEFEYFDSPSSTLMTQSIALPPKKRKPTTTQSSEKTTVTSTRRKSVQNPSRKSAKSHSWPSRNKVYPRKKRYPCDWPHCGYVADRPSTLVRHARAHTGEKPYACDWPGCDKRYKMSSNLTPHKLTHTGEKPYKCDWPQCPKRFTYPQHLKRHRIAHQKRTRRQRVETSRNLSDASKKIKQTVDDLSSCLI